MAHVHTLPAAFQDLFGPIAQQLGRETGFILRQRAFGADDFLTVLTFGYLHDSQATFASLASELDLTESALQQRYNEPATLAFLQAILATALEVVLVTRPKHLRALRPFNGVYLTDSTTLPLPESLTHLFPSCGGGAHGKAPSAMLKILVTYEVQSGRIHALTLHAGKDSDGGLPWLEDLPPGSLHLTDLGFYEQERLQRDTDAGQYWITRLSCNNTRRAAADSTADIVDLLTFLETRGTDLVDEPVIMGSAAHAYPLLGRLTAWRCTPAEQRRRERRLYERAKTEKRKVTPQLLALCCWLVYLTNVPAPQLRPQELGELYRVRWQIELLFKRWKSWFALAKPIQKKKENSGLVELYARLVGLVVAEWLGVACGGPLALPLVQVVKALKKWCVSLGELLRQGGTAFADLLARILQQRQRFRPRKGERCQRVKTRNRLNFTVDFA